MNNNKEALKFVLISAVVLILVMGAGYTIKEGEQVVITLFGKPVRMVKEAGIHWKWPLIEKVREIDLRMLNWDGFPNQIPTRDKKYITVDTTARWRIMDPQKFIQSVQSQQGAQSRLDAILDATTRDIISSHNLVEAVRNSNAIFDVIQKRAEGKDPSTTFMEEEVIGDIERVEIGRENLAKMILERASKELLPIGIELIDVQIRRIMYEASVQKKVYARMVSERERIAEKIRSIGKGEQAKIEGKTSREVQELQSLAYRTSQKLKGDAEAKSIAIYAGVLNQDPSFYEFTRKLEAYRASIKSDTRVIMGSGSKFFDVMTNGK
jgi:membrane protease subunit HflC